LWFWLLRVRVPSVTPSVLRLEHSAKCLNKGSADDCLAVSKLQLSAIPAEILLPFVTSLGPVTEPSKVNVWPTIRLRAFSETHLATKLWKICGFCGSIEVIPPVVYYSGPRCSPKNGRQRTRRSYDMSSLTWQPLFSRCNWLPPRVRPSASTETHLRRAACGCNKIVSQLEEYGFVHSVLRIGLRTRCPPPGDAKEKTRSSEKGTIRRTTYVENLGMAAFFSPKPESQLNWAHLPDQHSKILRDLGPPYSKSIGSSIDDFTHELI
jgi:hypothetical protein